MTFRLLLTLLAVSLVSPTAYGQIVNVLNEDQAEAKGFSGEVGLAIDHSTGNVDETEAEGSINLQYHWPESLVMLILRTTYGQEAGNVSEQSTFAHLRYRLTVWDPIGVESFVQHESDISRRLNHRALFGLGPRVRLASWSGGDLHLGVAYMAEYEALDDNEDAGDADETYLRHRTSNYLAFTSAVTDKITIGESVFFQPRLDSFDKYRLMSESSVEFSIHENFALILSYVWRHDSDPYDEVLDTDSELHTELEWSF